MGEIRRIARKYKNSGNEAKESLKTKDITFWLLQVARLLHANQRLKGAKSARSAQTKRRLPSKKEWGWSNDNKSATEDRHPRTNSPLPRDRALLHWFRPAGTDSEGWQPRCRTPELRKQSENVYENKETPICRGGPCGRPRATRRVTGARAASKRHSLHLAKEEGSNPAEG